MTAEKSRAMGVDELRDLILEVSKEARKDEIGEQISEEIAKHYAEWEKKSEAQRKADETRSKIESMKKMLYGESPAERARKSATGKWDDGAFTAKGIASVLPYLAQAKCDKGFAIQAATKAGRDDVVKALEASDFTAGGALLPEELSADFIGFLYNRTAVRRMGANVVQMPRGGSLDFGKMNTTATAYWGGETQAITASEPSFKRIRLGAKKLRVLVPLSNDLIRQSAPGFESIVRDDLVNVAVVAEDSKFIRGDGSQGTPEGIYNLVRAGNKFTATNGGSETLATKTEDLLRAMFLVDDANIPGDRYGWMLNPRTKYHLASLRTDDGYLVFFQELMNGMLFGHPYAMTKNIPRNLNAGGDETEIYFGDFSQLIIGDTLSVQVEMADAASWVQGATTHHGFQEDTSLLRLIHESDITMRHDSAFAVIEGVDWGNGLTA